MASIATDLPYAAEAETSLSYDELEVSLGGEYRVRRSGLRRVALGASSPWAVFAMLADWGGHDESCHRAVRHRHARYTRAFAAAST